MLLIITSGSITLPFPYTIDISVDPQSNRVTNISTTPVSNIPKENEPDFVPQKAQTKNNLIPFLVDLSQLSSSIPSELKVSNDRPIFNDFGNVMDLEAAGILFKNLVDEVNALRNSIKNKSLIKKEDLEIMINERDTLAKELSRAATERDSLREKVKSAPSVAPIETTDVPLPPRVACPESPDRFFVKQVSQVIQNTAKISRKLNKLLYSVESDQPDVDDVSAEDDSIKKLKEILEASTQVTYQLNEAEDFVQKHTSSGNTEKVPFDNDGPMGSENNEKIRRRDELIKGLTASLEEAKALKDMCINSLELMTTLNDINSIPSPSQNNKVPEEAAVADVKVSEEVEIQPSEKPEVDEAKIIDEFLNKTSQEDEVSQNSEENNESRVTDAEPHSLEETPTTPKRKTKRSKNNRRNQVHKKRKHGKRNNGLRSPSEVNRHSMSKRFERRGGHRSIKHEKRGHGHERFGSRRRGFKKSRQEEFGYRGNEPERFGSRDHRPRRHRPQRNFARNRLSMFDDFESKRFNKRRGQKRSTRSSMSDDFGRKRTHRPRNNFKNFEQNRFAVFRGFEDQSGSGPSDQQ